MTERPLRIATRASRLALWQAEYVAGRWRDLYAAHPVELVKVSTLGDRDLSGALRQMPELGVFTREVQLAVRDGRADLAVHSLKDLPTEPAAGFVLAAVPERGPILDALVLPARQSPGADPWQELPAQARVGTGSPRRRAQLWHRRPDLQFLEVRGNVETRLRKLDAGEYDALILAEAGLQRLGLASRISALLAPPLLYPAVGQGALGLECRADDFELQALLAPLRHEGTWRSVQAERALLADLRAGCHAPLGVWSEVTAAALTLTGVVLSPDGQTRVEATESVSADAAPEELGQRVAARLREQGAAALIADAPRTP